MIKYCWLMVALLFFPVVSRALTVPITVQEAAGVERTGEYIRRGVPLPVDSGCVSTSVIYMSTDEAGLSPVSAQQFHVLSRWDTDGNGADSGDPLRVVLAVWAADVPANSTTTYYLHTTGGGGTSSGANIASDEAGYHKMDSGSMEIRLSEAAGFNFINRATVDGVDIISSPSTDGIVARYAGVDYTSFNSDTIPTIKIEYNGPLMACVTVEGDLQDASNNQLIPPDGINGITYKIFYWMYAGERTIRPVVTIKNENNGYAAGDAYPAMATLDLDYLYIRTSLMGLGTPTAVRFGAGVEGGAIFEDTAAPSGVYAVAQDHPAWDADSTTQNDFAAMSYTVGAVGSETTNSADRFDSYTQLRDASRGVMIANRWFWQNYWKSIRVDATNKRIDYYLWDDKSYTHPFIGGAWKTHELFYSFHGDVSGDYSFDQDLASLKNQLRAYPATELTSNYYYKLPPKNVTCDVYYNDTPTESVQAAIGYYEKHSIALLDGSVSDDTAVYGYDFDDFRERREYTFEYGVYSGNYANWYGWLSFGDGIRSGGYGPGAQNYDWVWMALVGGNRNQSNYFLDLADQFARHYGDILIIHNPVDDPTTAVATGIRVADVHGGQRQEHDTVGYSGSFKYTTMGGNEPGDVAHMWASGYLWTYLLYGDPLVLDVAAHIADHLVYRHSSNTVHSTQPDTDRHCNLNHCYSSTPETRMYSRAIGMLVDIWKITGDTTYLNLSSDIFTNGILLNEYTDNGDPQGFINFYFPTTLGDAWVGYDAYITLDLIQLHRALSTSGESTVSSQIVSFLTRQANWVKNTLYTKWDNGTSGGYVGNTYFPYQVPLGYFYDPLKASTGSDDGSYNHAFTQGFAFLYEQTGNQAWLDLARVAWRDGFAYPAGFGSANHDYVTIRNSDPLPFIGSNAAPSSGWLKWAKQVRHSTYYLAVEANVGQYSWGNAFKLPSLRFGGYPVKILE